MPRKTVPTAAAFLPAKLTLPALREAAATCRGCDLYKNATQTVFGEGRSKAQLMFIGEVPGDQEDLQGEPFVGPAGKILDQALEQIGLDRAEVYVTNAVKHFKWEPRGKKRLHKKPSRLEIVACKAWLDAEIEVVQPKLLVCLGATAAQALLGAKFRITQERGKIIPRGSNELSVLATYHPSAILRAPEKADRDRMRAEFVQDLRRATQWARQH
jgi:uracil-DNA glycosylase